MPKLEILETPAETLSECAVDCYIANLQKSISQLHNQLHNQPDNQTDNQPDNPPDNQWKYSGAPPGPTLVKQDNARACDVAILEELKAYIDYKHALLDSKLDRMLDQMRMI